MAQTDARAQGRTASLGIILAAGILLFISVRASSAHVPESGGRTPLAQSARRSWGLTVQLGAGPLVVHHPWMIPLRETLPRTLSVGWFLTANPRSDNLRFFGYPTLRVSYQLMHLGSPQYLGYAHALFPSMQFYLLRASRFSLELDMACGLAYVPRAYMAKRNPYNGSIGTPLNAYLSLGLGAGVQIGTSAHVSASMRLTHLSNGSFSRPNTGLNYVMVGLEYAHRLAYRPADTCSPQEYTLPTHSLRLQLAGGAKAVGSPLGRKAAKFSIFAQYLYAPTPYLGFWGELDYAADYALWPSHRVDSRAAKSPWLLPYVGIIAGTELVLWRIHASLGVGSYLRQPPGNPVYVYERLRLAYRFTPRILGTIGVQAHAFSADLLEFGVQVPILQWKRHESR